MISFEQKHMFCIACLAAILIQRSSSSSAAHRSLFVTLPHPEILPCYAESVSRMYTMDNRAQITPCLLGSSSLSFAVVRDRGAVTFQLEEVHACKSSLLDNLPGFLPCCGLSAG